MLDDARSQWIAVPVGVWGWKILIDRRGSEEELPRPPEPERVDAQRGAGGANHRNGEGIRPIVNHRYWPILIAWKTLPRERKKFGPGRCRTEGQRKDATEKMFTGLVASQVGCGRQRVGSWVSKTPMSPARPNNKVRDDRRFERANTERSNTIRRRWFRSID